MRELSLNVLDVAQNSISAGGTVICISVSEDTVGGIMTIEISDNGRGMTAEQVSRVIDPFYTTRTTRRVGLGVPLFKMAAEATGGSFSITSKVGEGTVVRAEFISTHVDMTPLGDIDSTVCLLVRCNPDLDFVYTYSKDGRSFSLDTREVRQVLEEVPLDSPEVLEWIAEYLKENTLEVQ